LKRHLTAPSSREIPSPPACSTRSRPSAIAKIGAVAPIAWFGRNRAEAPLRRSDWPGLACVVVAGGIVAPVLLMLGLERVSGIAGSLLLNLEGPFTLIVGVFVLMAAAMWLLYRAIKGWLELEERRPMYS